MTREDVAVLRRRRGYWLRLARDAANLNQNEVARRLGLSERSGTTVLAWEKGLRSPDADQLLQLAQIYGVPVSVFSDPKSTDEEWLDEVVSAAGELERADWEREQGARRDAADGPSVEPRRRSA